MEAGRAVAVTAAETVAAAAAAMAGERVVVAMAAAAMEAAAELAVRRADTGNQGSRCPTDSAHRQLHCRRALRSVRHVRVPHPGRHHYWLPSKSIHTAAHWG